MITLNKEEKSRILVPEFLKKYTDFDITLDYCWDNTPEYNSYLKQGYTEKEILEEFEIELEEWDEEYSFYGSYEEFLEFQKFYDAWDDIYLSLVQELKIDIVNKKIDIKYVAISYNSW